MEEKAVNQELKDQQLEQAAGGSHECGVYTTEVIERDNEGRPTHWRDMYRDNYVSDTYHYVCPRCGRILHSGTLGRLYCDPCDESWFTWSLNRCY